MGPMTIAFRTEGGSETGLGHIRRSMALARELQRRGAKIYFLVNEHPVALNVLCRYGFETVGVGKDDEQDLLETLGKVRRWNARVLIVDSYKIRDFSPLRDCLAFAVLIDDLADRPVCADMVINGAACAAELPYPLSPRTRLLLGSKYVLLRDEFSQEPERCIRERIKRVLITLGGIDHLALTPWLVHWTREVLETVDIDVVVGPFFSPEIVFELEQLAQRDPLIALHKDPPKIRDLMLACDLAITGGGQTTYELAATGTPAVAIRLADNQSGNLRGLSARRTLEWTGDVHDGDLENRVVGALQGLAENPDKRAKMSRAGRVLVDGGGAGRVAHAVLEACSQ